MAARTKKSNTTPVDPNPVDLEPVDLDPRPPHLEAWDRLCEKAGGNGTIYHGGDASVVMSIPRPIWADPDEDLVGRSMLVTSYKSSSAYVTFSHQTGKSDGEKWYSAGMYISAKMFDDGEPLIGISYSDADMITGEWNKPVTANMTPAEALELAEVLRAAVALFGGDK
ncbi:hypothetical protein ACN27E_23565 [Mycobacterium sp. WMMD1722]|uniref:hypothetical protein n=1 Tax=Mycobacterium sp. WMMD1722 TaxID=3404117 RepID=UPI003BF50E8A